MRLHPRKLYADRYLKQLHASGQRSAAITGLSALVDECRSKGWAKKDVPMMVRVYLRLGLWNLELSEEYVCLPGSPSTAIGIARAATATLALSHGVFFIFTLLCVVLMHAHAHNDVMLQVCDSG